MYPWLIHQMLLDGSTWPPGACEALWHYTALQQTSADSRTQIRDVMDGPARESGDMLFFFSVCKENFILNSKYSLLSQNKESQVNSLLFMFWPNITRHFGKQKPHPGREDMAGPWSGPEVCSWDVCLLPTLEQGAERKTQAFSLFLFSQWDPPSLCVSSVCFSCQPLIDVPKDVCHECP